MHHHTPHFELAIVGAGLSGSLLTTQLLASLRTAGAARALRIFNCDRDGAFGRGVPYGLRHAQPGFLLIEPVAQSTPAEFHRWLATHAARLAAEAQRSHDPALRAWIVANEAAMAAAHFAELFVPRRWFGEFTREQHALALAGARALGSAEVSLVHGECTDLQCAPRGFDLALADGSHVSAEVAVLAIGNIPRAHRFAVEFSDGYLHDIWSHGYDGLRSLVEARGVALDRGLDLVLIGSGATAGEVVYFLAHHPALLQRIRSIRVVSRSGYLAGGGAPPSASSVPVRADALARPAAREYVAASRELALAGLLAAQPLEIRGGPRRLEDGRLAIDGLAGGVVHAVEADVIVNCSGSGDIDSSASTLLSNMLRAGSPFRPNHLNAGFARRAGSFEAAGADGCFILGPLLNEEAIETHVESIHGVYRAVARLVPALHARLLPLLTAAPSPA
jgi:uncharacterized NAD(P)/FAD-binding protein YdhS